MCEFCVKHGEGEKWYLQAKNYSDDLLNDARRRKFFEDFSDPDTVRNEVIRGDQRLERLAKAPKFIRDMISRVVTRKMITMKKQKLDGVFRACQQGAAW